MVNRVVSAGEDFRLPVEVNLHAGSTQALELASTTALATAAAIGNEGSIAVGDYTGRLGTAGTGTDFRAAIQSALNAASNRSDVTYYGYLTVKNGTVKLRSGDYHITAPTGGAASLIVPPRVTFDTSDATLFFDFPASACNTWCGIQVGQYGQLIIGRIYTTPGSSAPDTGMAYDAIRLWQTDNNTRVIGYKDSEISGFRGAGIRGVGAWITFIKGIRFTGLKYGYVASNYGDGTLGGTLSNPSGGGTNRAHTDLRIEDCHFANIANGGLLGVVQGKTGAINSPDSAVSNVTVGLVGCIFESIGWYSVSLTNTFTVSMFDCAFEEVGKTSGGMINIDTCRSMTLIGTRINLGGRSVPGPSGNVTPFPAYFLETASLQALVVQGMYVHNTYTSALTFASLAAGHWNISGVYPDGFDFAAGVMYTGQRTAISGAYNHGLTIGSRHLWVDNSGNLRQKNSAPTAHDDGTIIS